MITLSGEAAMSKVIYLPSQKDSSPKGKNLLPLGANFPFRVEPFLEGD